MPTSVSTRASGSLNPTRQQLDELDALLKRMLELPVHPPEESDPSEIEDVADTPPPPPPPVRPPVKKPIAPPPASPPARSEEKGERVRGTRPAVSYMVVETASPRPLPAASGFEPRPPAYTPPLPTPPPVEEREESPDPFVGFVPEPSTEEADDPEMWVPLRSTWQPSPQTWPPLADSWHQANGAGAPPREVPLTQPVPTPTPQPVEAVQPSPSVPPIHAKPVEAPAPVPAAPVVPTPAEPRLSLTEADAPPPVSPLLLPLLWFNQGFDSCMTPLGEAGRWLCGSRGRQTLGLAGLACLAAAVVLALAAGMGWCW